MKDQVKEFTRKYRFLIAILAVAFLKQLLVVGLPIFALPDAACDDQLFKNWAFSMARMDWTGAYNAYTFMKEPGFSFFLAVCYRLHLPYIFTLTLGYSIASMIFATALNKIFSSRVFIFIIYIIILFHPVAFSLYVLQRVYRSGLGMILTLMFFGVFLHMYFSILEEKQWKFVAWSILSGLTLGYLWVSKNDTIWLLPFTIVVCIVMFGILLVRRRSLTNIIYYICLTFPFLGIFLFSYTVEFCNTHWYGYPNVEYYGAAMDDLTHIKQENSTDKISLSRKQLRELYKISPTLAKAKETLELAFDENAKFDTDPEDGEVEDGWLGWALLYGFANSGIYQSCETANDFYRNIHNELQTAFADGRLEKVKVTTAQNYYIDTPQHRKKLMECIKGTIKYMISFQEAYARVFSSGKKNAGVEEFEQLTRNSAVYDNQKHDYAITGWILFPEYHRKDLEIYVEDKAGKQYKKLNFIKSMDVYQKLQGTKYETEDAKHCRFQVEWNAEEYKGKEDISWYLAAYKDGELLDRVFIQLEDIETNIFGKGCIDAYICKKENDRVIAAGEITVKRLDVITYFYQLMGRPFFWMGIISYVILTIVVILELRKKKFEQLNAWLVATGLGLSIIVFSAGIAVVHLTQCPAISEMYLSAAYAILLGAELISILKILELIGNYYVCLHKH